MSVFQKWHRCVWSCLEGKVQLNTAPLLFSYLWFWDICAVLHSFLSVWDKRRLQCSFFWFEAQGIEFRPKIHCFSFESNWIGLWSSEEVIREKQNSGVKCKQNQLLDCLERKVCKYFVSLNLTDQKYCVHLVFQADHAENLWPYLWFWN